MTAIADRFAAQIMENAPVELHGLVWHPLLVRDYFLYTRAKEAFELMLGSLKDPKLARLPWCSCLWALDMKYGQETGKTGEFLVNVLCVMAKALRLDVFDDGQSGTGGAFPIQPVFADNVLTAIVVGSLYGEHTLLSMQQMNDIRELIAAQNGYDIPDENWNPELVKAAQDNAKGSLSGIEYSFESLVYSVAVNAHCRAGDIYGWPIREFHQTEKAISRTLNYQIYTLAENAGFVQFKKGNPYPTWKFDRKSDMPTGFRTIAEIEASAEGMISGT